ncbi:hypothetical protein E4P54_16605 [Salmonella enterica subsp. enterica serovar Panama]|uniref:hypothetical protein n=1 Tax=Enterobacteriaceae TaxID=543 RepID=UPI001472E122|nr:hypothetical protein [Salmonella enterica]EGO0258927.1 hypothetical protein [Salmonella enterica subsp. enterica serovar Panama]EGP7450156.1 hypothetical protein [Salmonella enterica subsp. enterica serovar Panama]NMF70722.1 hypothetical protein [Salmonella enterica subsp. enterica serovar Panama]NMF75446.1 hypothetical protein [Salmonella enterica subsp. enterica serovar Panama]NMF80171.1 hypothetical protein [Salmonella enterica subsp. enterica serovar Panama]
MPNLLRYDQLDSSRQPAARASAASGELWCARNNVKKQAAASKAAIHQAINDHHRITRLRNTFSLAKDMRDKPVDWIEKRILENLCMFNEQGDMYLFTQQNFVSKL